MPSVWAAAGVKAAAVRLSDEATGGASESRTARVAGSCGVEVGMWYVLIC